jgi:hypothetical protein
MFSLLLARDRQILALSNEISAWNCRILHWGPGYGRFARQWRHKLRHLLRRLFRRDSDPVRVVPVVGAGSLRLYGRYLALHCVPSPRLISPIHLAQLARLAQLAQQVTPYLGEGRHESLPPRSSRSLRQTMPSFLVCPPAAPYTGMSRSPYTQMSRFPYTKVSNSPDRQATVFLL